MPTFARSVKQYKIPQQIGSDVSKSKIEISKLLKLGAIEKYLTSKEQLFISN